MMKLWKRVARNRLAKLTALGLVFLSLSGGLVFIPTAWNPYVRVPGSTIALKVNCVASDIYLQLRSTHFRAQRAELIVRDLSGKTKAERFPMDLQKSLEGQTVHLTLAQSYQQDAREYLGKLGDGGSDVSAVIELLRVPSISLDAARVVVSEQYTTNACKDQDLDAEDLRVALSASEAQLMRYRRPQDVISDGILQANDVVGSMVLAGMIVISCWLLWLTSAGFVQAYISREKTLSSFLRRDRDAAMQRGLSVTDVEIVRNRFHLAERRFIFWRVVGPALGFILTISSLVEGLHPSRQGSQDSFLLVSTLQLALVATFLGLWIRILAELAIRFHRTAAERRLVYLSASKSSGASDAA